MGGDFGPQPVVDGAVAAVRNLGIPSVIVGNEGEIRARLEKLGASTDERIRVQHASQTVTMDDSPSSVLRKKQEASICIAFELVRRGDACAVVSPGNTGAVMAAGMMISGTLPGIARPAIATLIPRVGNKPPTVLLDSGANVDCNASQLVHFALMGNHYARVAIGAEKPRVALLSNGTEPSKGTDLIRSAAQMLAEMPELNFIGYVEGRDISRDRADVVVCDGFVGNVLLKGMEGAVELVFDSIKHYLESSVRAKLGMWLCKPMFKRLFRDKLDPSAYGGAPLLGLCDTAIICHGSSGARAIENAIRVAHSSWQQDLSANLSAALAGFDMKGAGGYEDGIWNRMGQRFERRAKKSQQPAGPRKSE
ncbi:MAG: phosphate acyltransferase PlsX [Oligoflexia bacterium]|nr:phosphate acyltransferase PlsX [Oligoflexia bacterium]